MSSVPNARLPLWQDPHFFSWKTEWFAIPVAPAFMVKSAGWQSAHFAFGAAWLECLNTTTPGDASPASWIVRLSSSLRGATRLGGAARNSCIARIGGPRFLMAVRARGLVLRRCRRATVVAGPARAPGVHFLVARPVRGVEHLERFRVAWRTLPTREVHVRRVVEGHGHPGSGIPAENEVRWESHWRRGCGLSGGCIAGRAGGEDERGR